MNMCDNCQGPYDTFSQNSCSSAQHGTLPACMSTHKNFFLLLKKLFSRSTHHVPFFRLFITLFFIRPRSPSLSYYSFYVPLFAQFPDSLWFFAPFAYNFWSCLLLSFIQCSMNTTCCHIFVTNESACNLQNVDAVSTILTTTILNMSLKSDKKEKVLSYTQVEQPLAKIIFTQSTKGHLIFLLFWRNDYIYKNGLGNAHPALCNTFL